MKLRHIVAILAITVFTCSCGEYNKVLKSTDNNYKYAYAKQAFEKKKYVQCYTILQDLVKVFNGEERGEECLYLLGLSYYENQEYANAGIYFKSYYTKYPNGQYAELARFYAGYGYYLDSPEAQLDQSETLKAIEELQAFLDYFPKSDKVATAQKAIFEMQDKLVLKELENAQLYYNLGNYMGNNYESTVITAKNALKEYPYTKYKEQLEFLILKARYKEADESVLEKKEDRFRTVIDEYYSFINDFPDSNNRKEADNIFKIASKYVETR